MNWKLKDIFFERNLDSIFCTECGEPDNLRRKVDSFHKKLEFTMERTDKNGNLKLLDMSINVNRNLIVSGTRNQPIWVLSRFPVSVRQCNIRKIS